MQVPNDLQFDTETYLLFSVYYKAHPILEDMDESAATYVRRFDKEIQGAGQVLEWLGLATANKSSPLGWKPSHDLVSLILESRRPLKGSKRFPTDEDTKVFTMIIDAAVGKVEEWPSIYCFVVEVFHLLGLAKEADLAFVPTPLLRALACKRRQEQRHQRDEESECGSIPATD
jgi:hypothetical protein